MSTVGRGDDRAAREAAAITLAEYDRMAEAYRQGTADHDVSQNIAALLDAIEGAPPYAILDLGCGPGRDLIAPSPNSGMRSQASDGAAALVALARDRDRLHRCCMQDFLALDLPSACFDGIFANASLFHVPSSQIARVLSDLAAALKPGGVLFCSNPRGDNQEGWVGGRYGCFYDLETWRALVTGAGFAELHHYYHARPAARATSSPGSPPSGARRNLLVGGTRFEGNGRREMKVRRILFLSPAWSACTRRRIGKAGRTPLKSCWSRTERGCVGGTSWRLQALWSWLAPRVPTRAIWTCSA